MNSFIYQDHGPSPDLLNSDNATTGLLDVYTCFVSIIIVIPPICPCFESPSYICIVIYNQYIHPKSLFVFYDKSLYDTKDMLQAYKQSYD